MGTEHVDDPMGREGGNAQDDEEADDIVLLGLNLLGPNVEFRFPLGHGEQRWSQSGAYKVAKRTTSGDTCAGEREGAWDTPNRTSENGEVHGTWKRECLEAIGGHIRIRGRCLKGKMEGLVLTRGKL